MAGYFGDEPTCARCDYPRRLHHLLRVDHDYTERPNENAPGAGATATEGNESDPQQTGDSPMKLTFPDPARVLAELPEDQREDGTTVVLYTCTQGPFTGRISRYVYQHDHTGETVIDPIHITIDSSEQDGGQMFHDLTILDGQTSDFTVLVGALLAAYRQITGGAK